MNDGHFFYLHSYGSWIEKRDPIASIENCFILFNICKEISLIYILATCSLHSTARSYNTSYINSTQSAYKEAGIST